MIKTEGTARQEARAGRFLPRTICFGTLLLLCAFASPESAASALEQEVETLRAHLEQRELVILELIERVEALEMRLGVMPAESKQPPVTTPQAPDGLVVDRRVARRALERSVTQRRAELLEPGVLQVLPTFSWFQSSATESVLFEDAATLVPGSLFRESDVFVADLGLDLGLGGGFQLEVGVPWVRENVHIEDRVGFDTLSSTRQAAGELGDIRIGIARQLLGEGQWRPAVIGRIGWDSATGDTRLPGSGFDEFNVGMTFTQTQDPVVLFAGLSGSYARSNDGVRPGAAADAFAGGFLAISPRTSANLFFSLRRQGELRLNGVRREGTDSVSATMTLGVSTLIMRDRLLDLSLGVGLNEDGGNFSLGVAMPFSTLLPGSNWQGVY